MWLRLGKIKDHHQGRGHQGHPGRGLRLAKLGRRMVLMMSGLVGM